MIPVISNAVSAFEYDSVTQVLKLKFRTSWKVYDYCGVPQWFADEFLTPHPWRRVHRLMKQYTC
jgi:hypothetical protein